MTTRYKVIDADDSENPAGLALTLTNESTDDNGEWELVATYRREGGMKIRLVFKDC